MWNAEAPVDYDGPYWTGKQMVLQCPPVQSPHPPVAIACVTSLSSVELAGKLNLMMLTGDFIPASRLNKFGATLVATQAAHGHQPTRRNIRSTRVVYVAETDKKARDDMRASYQATIDWEIVNTPHHQNERVPDGGTLDDITFDRLVDNGNLFVGSPETVYKRVLEFYDQVGGFGLLIVPSLDLVIYKLGGKDGQYEPALTGLPQPAFADKSRENWQPIPRTAFNEGSLGGDDGLRRVLEFVALSVMK
jgi:alkanesulfonate monooxygenase SsuD/methylene tetrahydromethanopterin reductase-like flavin-dependent oxidoreductase (luciferase family)